MVSDVPLCQDAQVPDVSCEQISCKKIMTLEGDPGTWLMLSQPFLQENWIEGVTVSQKRTPNMAVLSYRC